MELLRSVCVRRVLFCPVPGLPARAGAGGSAAGVSGPGEDEWRGGTVPGHVSSSAAGPLPYGVKEILIFLYFGFSSCITYCLILGLLLQ